MDNLLSDLLAHRQRAWCSLASIELELPAHRAKRVVEALLTQLSRAIARRAATVGELLALALAPHSWIELNPIRIADAALLPEDRATLALHRLLPVVRRDLVRTLERLPAELPLRSACRPRP